MRRAIPIIVVCVGVVSWAAVAQPTPEDALKAWRGGTLPAFSKVVAEGLQKELAEKKSDEAVIVRLAALRAFAAVAPKVTAEEDARTLEWVVRHPTLGPLLLTALSPRDNAARVVGVMTALRAEFGAGVEQLPELAVAACVVWDSPAHEGQSPADAARSACEVFGHLTRNRRALRMDPGALPWPVLVYLVDSRVSAAERRWALESFRLPAEPGRAYFLVRYDMTGFYSGAWKGGERQAYTLANIARLGGVCKDQAYFTAEVCRAYGIPATVCTGTSGQGEGFHAWVGLLRARNAATGKPQGAVFDFRTARYPDHGFWSGTVIEPQTGQKLADSEVAMVAEWCASAPAKRLLSRALLQSVELVGEPGRRVAVLKQALEAAPGNLGAWVALVNECAQPLTPAATMQEVSGVIERFAVGRYDDFAFKSFVTLAAVVEPVRRLQVLDRTSKLFPRRPDLLAELALRKGDAMRQAGRPVDALKLYEEVLEVALRYGPVALDAMARVDGLLRPAGRTAELVEHYKIAWTNMAVPEASGYVATTPWYIMGERYAAALEEAGDRAGAEGVRKRIRGMDRAGGGE